jgi:uncharacterized repeat protein (TIGR03803 family)
MKSYDLRPQRAGGRLASKAVLAAAGAALTAFGIFSALPTSADSGAISVLYSFTGQADGNSPTGALVRASDGSLYGTTNHQGSGASGGTVYRLTQGGAFATLNGFTQAQGADPIGGLTVGPDGSFYGAAAFGGANDDGTIFKISSDGTFSTLYSFSGSDGKIPWSTLTVGNDGSLYGTTYQGGTGGCGSNGCGTVFKITPGGTLTTLYSFADGADGALPESGVVQGADGNFYGVAAGGGANQLGTAFRVSPGGALATLYAFGGAEGSGRPVGNPVFDSSGTLYGTTEGQNDNGIVFAISPGGAFSVLHAFSGGDGSEPNPGGLTLASDGRLYGTTLGGGTGGYGAIYSLGTNGAFTLLHSFQSSDGAYPWSGLLEIGSGVFAGTTSAGGAGSYGTIYQFSTSAGGGSSSSSSSSSSGSSSSSSSSSSSGGSSSSSSSSSSGSSSSSSSSSSSGSSSSSSSSSSSGGSSSSSSSSSSGSSSSSSSSGSSSSGATSFITAAPSSLGFGNVARTNTSLPQTVTIKVLSGRYSPGAPTITGTDAADFAVHNNGCAGSMPQGGTCTMMLSFTPKRTAGALESATLHVNGNASAAVSLTGTSAPPTTVSPTSINFGTVPLLGSARGIVTLTNNQSSPVEALSIVSGLGFFESGNCLGRVAAFSSCTVVVKFTPVVPGVRAGTLTLIDTNDSASPHKVLLSGTGH